MKTLRRLALVMTALATLVVPVAHVAADDISNWSTTDDNNNRTPPNGWPSGTMLPSQVEPTGRSVMGAIARWYALMGGTNSAGILNTTAVRAATTAHYPNGFTRLTDGAAGAPPLFYGVDANSLCSADDGGSCIAASGGGYFVAQFPGNVADIREFGVVGDNTTDNSTALQNAFAWAAANNGTLYVPAREFYAATGITATVPAAGALTVIGPGEFRFAATVANGLTLNVTGSLSTVHLRDFTVLTSGAPATGAAIKLHQTIASLPLPANTTASDIVNVTVRGADGFGNTDYWTYGISEDYVSNLNINRFSYAGAFQAGTGINLAGGANANQIGVIYNISQANMIDANTGINYGNYTQGVTVNQSNFTGINYGVNTAGATDTAQLNVSDSQFACYKASIYNNGVPAVNIHHNLFYPLNAGANADVIFDTASNELSITENIFNGINANDGHTYLAIGLSTGSTSSNAVVQGNSISNMTQGILIGNLNVQGVRISNNEMSNVTTPYGTPQQISGAPAFLNSVSTTGPAYTGISAVGTTGTTPNYVRLTVANANGFVTGMWVCVSGTTLASEPEANICAPINVFDGTHIDLIGVGSNGNFGSSGGIVSAIP